MSDVAHFLVNKKDKPLCILVQKGRDDSIGPAAHENVWINKSIISMTKITSEAASHYTVPSVKAKSFNDFLMKNGVVPY